MRISRNVVFGMFGVAAAIGLIAIAIPRSYVRRQMREGDESARVDEASEDSFPASDPPSFSTPATAVSGPAS